MATAMIGGVQIVDQRPAHAQSANCYGIYNYLFDSDCGRENPYTDPCNISSPYFDPVACFNPGFTDPTDPGGGGGGTTEPPKPVLTRGQVVPANTREVDVNGPISVVVTLNSLAFQALITNTNPDIRFKNEEKDDRFPNNETDQLMTPELKDRLDRLAQLVKAEFPGKKLGVIEAYDVDYEHPQPPGKCLETDACTSLHYEGRAADINVVDPNGMPDSSKLGRLGQLAVDAGFPWVKFEDNLPHVHVSVPKPPGGFPEAPPRPPGPAAANDVIQPNETLRADAFIRSADGRFRLHYQNDRNLVLYRDPDAVALWATGLKPGGLGECIMQSDGNLVVYNGQGNPVWASGTVGNPGSRLVVQNDGNVVIYRPDGAPIWATNTVQP
jgi:hypothetical protein